MSSLSSSCSSASDLVAASSSLLVCDVNGTYRPASPDEVLHQARVVLSRRVRRGAAFESPAMVKEFLLLKLATLDHEVFCVAFVDAKHRLLAFREMFRGTLSQTSVYPREVVKAALELNAAAVVFAHNHPSGSTEPSMADELLTQTLKSALLLVDVRVLDHFVVGGDSATSFAQRGLL